jgi:hypothetical protein
MITARTAPTAVAMFSLDGAQHTVKVTLAPVMMIQSLIKKNLNREMRSDSFTFAIHTEHAIKTKSRRILPLLLR